MLVATPNHTREHRGGTDFAQWTGLYVSGLLLMVFVAAHLWSVHYASEMASTRFTFTSVGAKLQSRFSSLVDLSLLVLALVHGLLGMHRVIADLGICRPGALRAVGVVLSGAGVVGFWYGWLIYRAFVG
jgi:succinate dehydrogenase hydrophobic anchor subunit